MLGEFSLPTSIESPNAQERLTESLIGPRILIDEWWATAWVRTLWRKGSQLHIVLKISLHKTLSHLNLNYIMIAP